MEIRFLLFVNEKHAVSKRKSHLHPSLPLKPFIWHQIIEVWILWHPGGKTSVFPSQVSTCSSSTSPPRPSTTTWRSAAARWRPARSSTASAGLSSPSRSSALPTRPVSSSTATTRRTSRASTSRTKVLAASSRVSRVAPFDGNEKESKRA